MFIILWVILCVVIFLIASCGVFLTRGHQKRSVSNVETKTPVVVTSTAHTVPAGYPIQTGGYQSTIHVPTYPNQNSVTVQVPMPMPMPMPPTMQNAQQNAQYGVQVPYVAPYPMSIPPPPAESNVNPPSYDTVVRAGAGAPTNSNNYTYEKQSAYNPNYAQ